jgi:hypothetical protein
MKRSFHLAPTNSTPEVLLDMEEATFELRGVCVPEDSAAFFRPIIKELDLFIPTIRTGAVFTFNLKYFNSSSLKGIYYIMRQVDQANDNGKGIKVVWMIEQEDEFMTDSALTFKELISTPIQIRSAAA